MQAVNLANDYEGMDAEDLENIKYFEKLGGDNVELESDWKYTKPTPGHVEAVKAKNIAGIVAKINEQEALNHNIKIRDEKVATTAADKTPKIPTVSLLDFDQVSISNTTPRNSNLERLAAAAKGTLKVSKPYTVAANNANFTAATTTSKNLVYLTSSALETNASADKPNLTKLELERDVKLKADAFMDSLLPPTAPETPFNINNLFGGLELRQEDVDLMDEAQFLIENVIVKGHVAAYVSPANGGKTTLFVHLCEELASGGNTIYYVNVDGSPSDLKRHHAHALKHGYTVVNPSARNQSNSAVMDKLTALAAGTYKLENVVIIIDTLKKFCDLINKSQSKKILEVFRALSVKGATVCLLGHTNKYKDANSGLEIYEGTSDLRNDVDELIYLDSIKDEVTKTLTITTRPDKVRATFEPISFKVDLEGDRKVTPLNEVVSIFCSEDHKLINLITKVIAAGDSKQQDIIDAVREQSEFSVSKIRSCLIRHRVDGDDYQKWSCELTGYKREYSYKLLPEKHSTWFDLDPININ